jgi:hypothetical protein
VIAVLLPLAHREPLTSLLLRAVQEQASVSHPLVVLDAGFHEACLPESAFPDAALREGLSDALFFGASPGRILVDGSGDGRWFHVGRGSPLPSPDAGWFHRDWPSLLERLTPANGITLLVLPGEFAGARALARQADDQTEWSLVTGRRALRPLLAVATLLLVALGASLAWVLGWLEGVGLPAPEPLPAALEDLVRRLSAGRG